MILKSARELEREKRVKGLVEKLKGNDQRAAYDAALQLGLCGNETAVEPLMDVAKRESGMMRKAALKALGGTGDARACPLLIEALRNSDDWVRMNALGSLQKITKQVHQTHEAWSRWLRVR